jgi:hypothetical protein
VTDQLPPSPDAAHHQPTPGWAPPPVGPDLDRSSAGGIRKLIGAVAVVGVIGFGVYGYFQQAERDEAGTIVGAGTVAADDLRVGDCFDDPSDLTDEIVEVEDVAAIPCDRPHDNEVFFAFDLTGDELPSDAAIEELVGQECLPAFDDFVGTPYEESELDLFAIWPTEASWLQGDRAVTCALYAMDGTKLDATAEGSTR